MPTKDPRTYVRSVPLPISSQKGLKIQARSIEVYNPSEPDRSVVRKQNYLRRSAQLTSQGFWSVNYKPYHGIGDPFFLEEKRLILHALGQWDESQEWETSSSSDEDASPSDPTAIQQHQTSKGKSFVLRRTRKDLNTLNKEVVRGRNMIRNVSLGHGLFDLIQQERMAKKAAAMADRQKRLDAKHNTWQPPKQDSDSDESEDELLGDSELDRYSLGGSGQTSNAPATRNTGSRKKAAQTPRPYTPQHISLKEMMQESEEFSQNALFRQLCVLNWILDAMNLETGYTMSSIMTCWSPKEIGGLKISAKKALQGKQYENNWERFLSTPMPGKPGKKSSSIRIFRHPRQSIRIMSNPRSSLQSTSPSPSSSSSAVNLSAVANTLAMSQREDAIPEEEAAGTAVSLDTALEDEPESAYSKSIFKFLDEYYESLRQQSVDEDGQAGRGSQAVGASTNSASDGQENKTSALNQDPEKQAKRHKKKKDREKTPDRLALYEMQEALGIPRGLRADKFVKPKPSAELVEFHEKKTSNKYQSLSVDLANKFKEVQDDQAMTLHDILEQMGRERFLKCQNKLTAMQTEASSVHRALEAMRQSREKKLHKPQDEELRRKSSLKGNWCMELEQKIPSSLKKLWYYEIILGKLRRYGLVENTSKQAVIKFLKVLEGLREWEICAPDIAAAVEFCRERIVDISIDEYEEWFASVFPRITRPQTAPPTLSGEQGRKEMAKGPADSAKRQNSMRQTKSAVVRRSQR